MAYADGGAYEGDWLMDRRNGVGRMVWAAGDAYAACAAAAKAAAATRRIPTGPSAPVRK